MTTLTIHGPSTVTASGNVDNKPEFVAVTGLSVNLATLNAIPLIDYSDFLIELVKQFGSGNDTINGLSRADLLTGYGGDDTTFGNGGNDTVSGEGNDTIHGGDGVDQIFGGEGNDTLNGDAGFDQLSGGAGDDTYILSDGTSINGALRFDSLVENPGEGIDTVLVSRRHWTLDPCSQC